MSSLPSLLRCRYSSCMRTMQKTISMLRSKQTCSNSCVLPMKSFCNEANLWSAHQRRTFASNSSYDPLARRPNKICDPYGQGGKPLSYKEALDLLATVQQDWKLIPDNPNETPTGLVREFNHDNFLTGSQFVTKIAAVATVHNHYPCIMLERRLLPKAWQFVTRVKCQTATLEGLSYHDFYLAMQIDVEVQRPEVKQLVLSDEGASK